MPVHLAIAIAALQFCMSSIGQLHSKNGKSIYKHGVEGNADHAHLHRSNGTGYDLHVYSQSWGQALLRGRGIHAF